MVSVHQAGCWPIQKSGGGILPAWRIRMMLRSVVEYRFANWGCRRATLSLIINALTLTLLFVRAISDSASMIEQERKWGTPELSL
jgi:hypothetical protein